MPLYQLADLVVNASIELPCVPRAHAGVGAWRLTVRRHQKSPRLTNSAWYQREQLPDGTRWRALGRSGDSHVIHFWRRAIFVVAFNARRITCYPSKSASLATIQQLFLGHVIPLLFLEEGALPLHASAVLTGHGALAFIARTGGGKSTLAAAMGIRGCSIVADDCAIVEVTDEFCRVRPLESGLRLRLDTLRMLQLTARSVKKHSGSVVPKKRVTAPMLGLQFHDRPARLHQIYFLEFVRGVRRPTIELVSRADAALALMVSSFQIATDEPARLRHMFEILSRVVTQAPVLRLSVPRGMQHLSEVVDAVLENVRNT
jgi:hypothetical protein